MRSTWTILRERRGCRVLAKSLVGAKCEPADPLTPREVTTSELNSMTLRLAASTLHGHVVARSTITAEPDGLDSLTHLAKGTCNSVNNENWQSQTARDFVNRHTLRP